MYDYYIHSKLATERAETLRTEAAADRIGKRVRAARRAERHASKLPYQTRRSLRAAH
jgi:ABC-type branched-subunit amino acid transport system ATPase component